MFQLKTFTDTIKPVMIFNIMLGNGSIAPFKNDRANTIAEIVYLFISLTIFNYLCYVQHLYEKSMIPQKILVNYTFAFIWWFTTYVTITIVIIITKFQTKKVREILNAVEKIDNQMETIGLRRQLWAQFKSQMFYLCMWLCQFFIYTMITYFLRMRPNAPFEHKILLSVAVHVVQHLIVPTELSFVAHVRQLNELLEEMIETLDRPLSERLIEESDGRLIQRRSKNDLRGNVEIIMKARKYHLELIELARRTNKFYGLKLLLVALSALVSIMIVLYKFNCFIWYPMAKTELSREAVSMAMYAVLISMWIVFLHGNCIYTTNEAKAAGFLLCRLYDSSTSTKFRAEVQNFTQQVLRNPLMFSVLGLVDFNRSFLPSLAGSIFAYLFVIVQLASTQWYFEQESAANATDMNLTLIVDN
ncbi:uncharacterized protein LOC144468543 [Augochlora pura]